MVPVAPPARQTLDAVGEAARRTFEAVRGELPAEDYGYSLGVGRPGDLFARMTLILPVPPDGGVDPETRFAVTDRFRAELERAGLDLAPLVSFFARGEPGVPPKSEESDA